MSWGSAEDGIEEGLGSLPDDVDTCYRVRATGEARKASSMLQALIDLSKVELAGEEHVPIQLRVARLGTCTCREC